MGQGQHWLDLNLYLLIFPFNNHPSSTVALPGKNKWKVKIIKLLKQLYASRPDERPEIREPHEIKSVKTVHHPSFRTKQKAFRGKHSATHLCMICVTVLFYIHKPISMIHLLASNLNIKTQKARKKGYKWKK